LRPSDYRTRQMKFFLLTLAAACACSISCERHEFEGKNGTKQLQESHGAHHPDHGSGAAHDKDKPDAP